MTARQPGAGSGDPGRSELDRPALWVDSGRGKPAVVLDGSHGEGGGQILRTALALAMITGRPLEMVQIRAGRARPGLRRQHLACVEAAARLCQAEVRDAQVGSQELAFTPGRIAGGELDIDIGTAGSTTLVVQTILVPAIAAGVALRAVIRGGTHNPLAPPFEFLERVWLPHLAAMGARVRLTLDRHGFATGGPARHHAAGEGGSAGGSQRRGDRHDDERRDDHGRGGRHAHGGRRGRIAAGKPRSGEARPADAGERRGSRDPGPVEHGQLTLEVAAGGGLRPLELVEAGPITARHATAILARLPTHVAEREHAVVQDRLGFAPGECETREVRAAGPANVLLLEIERAGGRELIAAFGERGLRAERVAERACDELAAYLAADVPVGVHLADQLLLPLAVAGAGRFRAMPLSLHATTNIATIQAFLDVAIDVVPDRAAGSQAGAEPAPVTVTIGGPGRPIAHL